MQTHGPRVEGEGIAGVRAYALRVKGFTAGFRSATCRAPMTVSCFACATWNLPGKGYNLRATVALPALRGDADLCNPRH